MRIFFLLIILSLKVSGQPLSDRQLILHKSIDSTCDISRKPNFGFSNNVSWYQRNNPIYVSAASLLYFYQKFVSPQLSATCGFSPSCSAMSKNLIAEFGILKGVFCSADRLTRCNRICFAELEPDEINPKDGKVHENTSRYK
ncbi:MAG: membrane protein insertion efficiency factor YidD [Bacteroidales bacterium]